MGQHLIYGLVDPETKFVFCVGQTKQGMNRPRQHWYRANGDTKTYIDSLKQRGLEYEVAVLEEVEPSRPERWCWWWDGANPSALCDAERWWIRYGRASGWPLTNILDGGPGAPGKRVSPTEKASISNRARARWADAAFRAHMIGKLRAPENVARARERARASTAAAHADPEKHGRMVAGIRRSWTPERRAQFGEVARQRQARQRLAKWFGVMLAGLDEKDIKLGNSDWWAQRRGVSKVTCGTASGCSLAYHRKRNGLDHCGPCEACKAAGAAATASRRERKRARP